MSRAAQRPPVTEFLISTDLTAEECGRCQAMILTGVSNGMPVKLDVQDLDVAGEIRALKDGFHTFSLTRERGMKLQAQLRTPMLIESEFTRPRPKVVKDHNCKGETS